MSFRLIAGAAIYVAIHGSAWAGPPFVTDDPQPVEHRHWEVNYAITDTWANANASAGVPSVDINYGVVPDVQLHVQPRYSYEKSADDVHSGLDDTEIGVKYRFVNVESEGSTFMVGVYPLYEVATGERRLGPERGKGQIFLPVWIERDTGKWTIYGGWGYRINPGSGFSNSVFSGATAIYEPTRGLQLGIELFHETPDTVDGSSVRGFNVGGIVQLTPGYNLLVSAGERSSDLRAHSVYLALQAHY